MKQKVSVVVCVYNRFHNLQRWIEIWRMCDHSHYDSITQTTYEYELIVIHNYDNEIDLFKYKKFCEENGINYIARENIGYDIGAFQDICRGRIHLDFDIILWCADDIYPMDKKFVWVFIKILNKKNVGLTCMEISSEYMSHVRTVNFCMRKETTQKIQFPADPVITKRQCYEFEHRGREKTLLVQIWNMGLIACQVAPIKKSVMWDTGHRKYLNRMHEHYAVFQTGEKVAFICPIYNSFPEIVSSLICQTNKDWKLILIHDGKNETNLKAYIDFLNDDRIVYIETSERKGNWGHYWRRWALNQEDLLADASHVIITNSDNYYCPTFIEKMLKGFYDSPDTVAAYTSLLAHSYLGYGMMNTELKLGYIDCGQVMVRKHIAVDVGWVSLDHSSDWDYFKAIMDKYGVENWRKVEGLLFVHN